MKYICPLCGCPKIQQEFFCVKCNQIDLIMDQLVKRAFTHGTSAAVIQWTDAKFKIIEAQMEIKDGKNPICTDPSKV